jgi:ribosomal protein S25
MCGFVATMGSPILSMEVKDRIVALHEEGMTWYAIAAKLNILRSIICTILKNFQLRGIVVSPKSIGRPC